ncbi:MAG TPA: nuclear transport factor 2 family protein, partial [Stellaceae bacterium]|nr:nuclear transport factor 2 family protein [Stellaceae bacterium]
MTGSAPTQDLTRWISAFEAALARCDIEAAADLFLPDGFWRDYLAFTWNLVTAEGHAAIRDMLQGSLAAAAPAQWQVIGGAREAEGVVEGRASFATATARCDAVIRLRDGKAWTLLTSMRELRDHEEEIGPRRPLGHPERYAIGRKSWRRQREAERAAIGTTRQPYCVIVGAGQGGLGLGARLNRLDVPTLLIDRQARPSDTWRNRHESLSLH